LLLPAAVIACVFVALAALTFVPSDAYLPDARRHFGEEDIARGRQRSFEGRLLFWASQAVTLAVLLTLVCGGWARPLADAADRLTGGRWLATAMLVAAAVFAAERLLHLPLDVLGGWWLPRRWGLSQRDLADWFTDYAKGLVLSAGIGLLLLAGFYGLMAWLPRWWWAAAAAGGTAFAVIGATLMPVLITPLFNTFTPLRETKWAALQPRVEVLVAEAGIPVGEVLVMDASRQGSHTNAYFIGFGSTRRIVLWDTLLIEHPPDEVISILAHEIGHWRHDHIVKGLALGAVGGLAGMLGLWLALNSEAVQRAVGFAGPTDPAAFPLILLLGFLASWAVRPVENAVSRHFERQADAASLELARMPAVFIEAERRLTRVNIGNVTPSPWNVWLFASHPPAVERIAMAEAAEESGGRVKTDR
jgi:STE24 endopeptidase